jgi:hypothetical protein
MDQFRQAEISPINKRSIDIDGHRTSVSLEDAFWVTQENRGNPQCPDGRTYCHDQQGTKAP